MSRRGMNAGCIVAGVVMVTWMASVTVVAQSAPAGDSSKTAAQGWTPPRTPWGDPDLQGVYTRMHLTVGAVPFERPRELGTRTELTDAELEVRMTARDKMADVGFTRPAGTSTDDVISPYLKPSRQTSVIVDPPDGRIPPRTAEGQKRIAAAAAARAVRPKTLADIGYAMFSRGDRCLGRGFPAAMNPATPNSAGMQLIQGPGWVAIDFELFGEYRLIPVSPRPPLGPKLRQLWGTSRGHWEGNSLVVEVTNVNGRGDGTFGTGPQMRFVERFTPISHGEMDYTYTIEDPEMLTRPVTIRASWGRHDVLETNEYACHAGNRDLPALIRIAQQEFLEQNPQGRAAPAGPGR